VRIANHGSELPQQHCRKLAAAQRTRLPESNVMVAPAITKGLAAK
jgi:hypothetical protein